MCRISRREPGRLPPGSSGPSRLRRESGARARRPRCARAVNAARPPMRRSSPTPSVAALCAVCAAGASHAADSARFVRSHEHREWGSRRRRDGVCARPDQTLRARPLSHTCVHIRACARSLCVCILGLRALPKNRGSRARAIPRATPPVPHAPIRAHTVRTPGSPFRASSRRGWRRRASSAAVHQPRLQRSARGARGAGRGGTSTAAARAGARWPRIATCRRRTTSPSPRAATMTSDSSTRVSIGRPSSRR